MLPADPPAEKRPLGQKSAGVAPNQAQEKSKKMPARGSVFSAESFNHPSGQPGVYMAPKPQLTVSDLERLAKAGVAVNLADVSVIPEMPEPKRPVDTWAEAVYSRLHANPKFRERMQAAFGSVVRLCGAAHEGKIYLFVAIGHDGMLSRKEPQVLVDDEHLFPSDALMAKLHLMWELA